MSLEALKRHPYITSTDVLIHHYIVYTMMEQRCCSEVDMLSDSDIQCPASCFDSNLLIPHNSCNNLCQSKLTCFHSWTIFWPVTKMELIRDVSGTDTALQFKALQHSRHHITALCFATTMCASIVFIEVPSKRTESFFMVMIPLTIPFFYSLGVVGYKSARCIRQLPCRFMICKHVITSRNKDDSTTEHSLHIQA